MKENKQFIIVLAAAVLIIAVICVFGFSNVLRSKKTGLEPMPLPDVSAVLGYEPNITDTLNSGEFVFRQINYVDKDGNSAADEDSYAGVSYHYVREDTRAGQLYNVEVIKESTEDYNERINSLNDTAEKIAYKDIEFVYAQRNQLCVNRGYEISELHQKQIDEKILELKYVDSPIEAEIRMIFSVMWYKDGMTYSVNCEGYGTDVKELLMQTAKELADKK